MRPAPKPERIRARNDAALIEVHRFDDRPSLTESTFKPLCLNVAAIHSIEPFTSTHYPGVKARLYLRKNGGSGWDRLELSENYPDLKRLIQQSQKEGFATLAT
jgi:hypothetical protein